MKWGSQLALPGLSGQVVLADPCSLAGVGWWACLETSVFQEPLEFGVHKGEARECCLVDGVLVTVGETCLLIQELLVKVVIHNF